MKRSICSHTGLFTVAFTSAFLLALPALSAQAATPDQEFWISRTVTQPKTRFFSGTMGGKPIWLRIAPTPGKSNEFRSEYSTSSAGPSVVKQNFCDGPLRAGALELQESSFEWDKNKVVSHPKFTLRGLNGAFPATLSGSGKDGKLSRTVQLREVSFGFPSNANLSVVSVDKNYPQLNYTMAIRYPKLSKPRGALSPALKGFNAAVEHVALASLDDFKNQMKDFDKGIAPSEKSNRPAAYEVGAFALNWAANDLASGELIEDVFYGGAHGVILHTPINYDFKRNRKLSLGELFVPGANYLQTLSSLCRPALHKWLAPTPGMQDDQDLNAGTTPKAENYDVWGLTPNGLTITFVDYQVGSYAQGESTVVIPYASLKSILKPEFVTRLKL